MGEGVYELSGDVKVMLPLLLTNRVVKFVPKKLRPAAPNSGRMSMATDEPSSFLESEPSPNPATPPSPFTKLGIGSTSPATRLNLLT